jgi:succinate dehydrogenase hydrophobic anchor subunit
MSNSGFTAFSGIILIIYLFFLVIAIVAWVKIISKAGYSGWVGPHRDRASCGCDHVLGLCVLEVAHPAAP